METRASIASDHKAVFLSINLNEEFNRGPGLWDVSRKFQSFVGNLNLNHFVEHGSLELEAEINIEEVHNALNSFQNNKTPGDNGFTKEFYEAFFDLKGAALLDSLNVGFESGTLSISQRRGVIS